MARQEIILGALPNGLGGDPPRVASEKINYMTQELYDRNAQLGSASAGVLTTSNNDNNAGRVTKVGDNGIGIPLQARVISDRTLPISRNTGFSLDLLVGGVPAGSTDGPMLTLAYDDTQAFQLYGDWRDGTIYTYGSANAASLKKWRKNYNVDNVVGTIDTDAIIERGSNASGQYTRFKDGTLICFSSYAAKTVDVSVPNGVGGFNSMVQPRSAHPFPFLGVPIQIVSVTSLTDSAIWSGSGDSGTEGEFKRYYFFAFTSGVRNIEVQTLAIGRWK